MNSEPANSSQPVHPAENSLGKPSASTPIPDLLEQDALWDLLDRVPARHASSNFSDRVLREIRLEADRVPSWRTRLAQLWAPAPLGGLAAACAGIALAWILTSPQVATDASSAAVNPPQHSPAAHAAVAIVTPIAEIQEIAETEVLIAAVDHLDAFSDQDLITLIGF